jgi:histidinol-phosphatase (PHP family)
MLSDYHVHLRHDGEGSDFARYMTTENVARYREAADAAGISELGVSEHVYRFRQALEIWDHPLWQTWAVDDIDEYVAFVRGTDLKLGIETDFVPGREQQIGELLEGRDWDYVLGSVHFLEQAALDMEEYDIWRSEASPDEIWREYFNTLAAAAASGLYDIMSHPDLVKIWGSHRPHPEGDLRRFYEPAVAAFAEAGVTVEISTAGLRKPVGEIYPAPGFIELCKDAGLKFALSSDAHEPEQIGFRYDDARRLLSEHGIDELAVFSHRERTMEPVG